MPTPIPTPTPASITDQQIASATSALYAYFTSNVFATFPQGIQASDALKVVQRLLLKVQEQVQQGTFSG